MPQKSKKRAEKEDFFYFFKKKREIICTAQKNAIPLHPLNETTAFNLHFGEVAEWSIAPVLKTDVPRGTGGSNPSLSAKKGSYQASFFVLEGMRTPEWGFVIDEVACQSKNPSLSAKGKKQTETQIYLKVCLLFLFARMPAAAQGMDEVNPSLSAEKQISK